jgi:hypothetical protein
VAAVSAVETVDAYLATLPGRTRRLAPGEWGVTVEAEAAAGWPLDIGVRVADGLLRAQAFVCRHDEMLDPWLFLHWNRQTRFVRFASARNGDVWLHGDLPATAIDERALDRLLGLLVEGAQVARRYAAEASSAR